MRALPRLGRALLALALTVPALMLVTAPAQAAPASLVTPRTWRRVTRDELPNLK